MNPPWQKPPRGTQLNKAHPLAKGFICTLSYNERTGAAVQNLAASAYPATMVNPANISWVPGGVEFSSNGAITLPEAFNDLITNNITVFTEIRWNGSGPNYECYFSTRTGQGDGYKLFHYGGELLWLLETSSTVYSVMANASLPLGRLTMAGTYDNVNLTLFINGVSVDQDAQTGAPTNPNAPIIGNASTLNSAPANKPMHLMYIWDRALSAAEIMWLHQEPYVIFEQVKPIFPLSIGQIFSVLAADGVVFTDTPLALAQFLSQIADEIILSDTPTSLATFVTQIVDGITLSDISSALAQFLSQTLDGILLTDTPVGFTTFEAQASDGIVLFDSTTAFLQMIATLSDGIKLSDTAIKNLILLALAADGITLTDTPGSTASFTVTVADGVSLSDTVTAVTKMIVSVVDGIKLTDTNFRVGAGIVTITYTSKKGNITFTVKKPK